MSRRATLSPPRLLPTTILTMGLLLGLKSVALVRAAAPAGAPAAAATVPPAAPAAAPAAVAPPTAADKPAPAQMAEGAKSQAAAEPAAMPARPEEISPSERALLLDLRARRAELDRREATLGAREAVLAAAEKRLGGRVEELAALQTRLEQLEQARRARDEANWRGLVKTYETMKPRDAAVIFNDLDQAVLLQLFDRMKETKSAGILSAMLPDRARQITSELAQSRLRDNSVPPAPPAVPSRPAPAGNSAAIPPRPAPGG